MNDWVRDHKDHGRKVRSRRRLLFTFLVFLLCVVACSDEPRVRPEQMMSMEECAREIGYNGPISSPYSFPVTVYKDRLAKATEAITVEDAATFFTGFSHRKIVQSRNSEGQPMAYWYLFYPIRPGKHIVLVEFDAKGTVTGVDEPIFDVPSSPPWESMRDIPCR